MKLSDLWREPPPEPVPVEYVWRPVETLLAAILVALIFVLFIVGSQP